MESWSWTVTGPRALALQRTDRVLTDEQSFHKWLREEQSLCAQGSAQITGIRGRDQDRAGRPPKLSNVHQEKSTLKT